MNLKSSIEQLKSKIITLTQLVSSQEKNNIENQEIALLKEKIKIKEKRLSLMDICEEIKNPSNIRLLPVIYLREIK